MFSFSVATIVIAAIFLLHQAFTAIGDKTRFARFAQGVIGVTAAVLGTFGIALIF